MNNSYYVRNKLYKNGINSVGGGETSLNKIYPAYAYAIELQLIILVQTLKEE